jgi:uncharacterized membrane protein YeaQ/YmgE (transglycosylase-associated protein family)
MISTRFIATLCFVIGSIAGALAPYVVLCRTGIFVKPLWCLVCAITVGAILSLLGSLVTKRILTPDSRPKRFALDIDQVAEQIRLVFEDSIRAGDGFTQWTELTPSKNAQMDSSGTLVLSFTADYRDFAMSSHRRDVDLGKVSCTLNLDVILQDRGGDTDVELIFNTTRGIEGEIGESIQNETRKLFLTSSMKNSLVRN